MYLITLVLVNKLSNCESTYRSERLDDVRDKMINTTDMGDFGSRLLLVGLEALYFWGEHTLSRVTERQTANNISQLLKQWFE